MAQIEGCKVVLFTASIATCIPLTQPQPYHYIGGFHDSGTAVGACQSVYDFWKSVALLDPMWGQDGCPIPDAFPEFNAACYETQFFDYDDHDYDVVQFADGSYSRDHGEQYIGHTQDLSHEIMWKLCEIETLLRPGFDPDGGFPVPIIGSGIIIQHGMWGVDINIVGGTPPDIDNWWGQADTGRIGLVVPFYNSVVPPLLYGKPQWINFTNQRFLFGLGGIGTPG